MRHVTADRTGEEPVMWSLMMWKRFQSFPDRNWKIIGKVDHKYGPMEIYLQKRRTELWSFGL